ncbi:gliding motility protein GldM [Cyclobacterium amurskyense]|jgi:gliding motility-associated protein GldM|uniref:type IX secretion system motor protein PorM/GldM n=1 Tax=Cyclobacterium amurskyense TaxID=320787 RepID=UPI0030DC3241|tara:strand:+ start:20616 stop:22217 length:1602 start_codon:yes stop_codon:yes gene_type:complete
MAGGKETPRQRMIGMMYLVLTALLALQVSNQILQKFVLINDGLERTAKNYVQKNLFSVNIISTTVEQQGNNIVDIPKVEAAKEIRKKSAELVSYLEEAKTRLIEESNAIDEQGNFRTSALKNVDIPGNIFNNNRLGYEMQEKLNSFPAEIEQILSELKINKSFEKIAKDASEIDLFKNDVDVNFKDYVNLNYVKSPIGAVLAIISQHQNEVLNIESEALTEITNSLGSFIFEADKLKARIAANSNVVAAGTTFEAEMFLASSSSSTDLKMTADGRSVPVEDGFGQIKFPVAPASNYDDRGLAARSLKGEITVPIGGQDSVFTINYDYFVAQPVIKVSSEVVNQLYAECANDLVIEVPALGNSYAPSFDVAGGQAIKGSKPSEVTVIPVASGKVNITVSSGGNKIGTVGYDIKPVPAPTIRPFNGDTQIDLQNPIPANGLTNLQIRAIPEPTFGRTMSRDANFEVTAGEVRLVRNDVPRESVAISGKNVAVRNLLAQAQSGDKLVVIVREVTRTNFKGNKIKSSVTEVYPISIK